MQESERTSKAWEEKIISKDMPILQGRSSAANKFDIADKWAGLVTVFSP
jgi:hypothetical protein